jgi:RNA polymerase sigma-B factor
MTAPGAQVLHLELPNEPAAPAMARRAAAELASHLRTADRADLMVLLSELIAVAVGERRRPLFVSIWRTPAGFRLEVRSTSGVEPPDDLARVLFDRLTVRWAASDEAIEVEFEAALPFEDTQSEEDLFRRVAAGDSRAEEELAQRYRGLARAISRRFVRSGLRRDDLEQVAQVGLVNALTRFDPERGVKFTTFAARTIDGELKRYLRDSTWSVRVPRGLQELGLEANRMAADLTQRAGREPSLEELAAALDADPGEVGQALLARRSLDAVSLEAPVAGKEGLQLKDALPSHDDRLMSAPEWADVSLVMDHLPDRERRIIYLRFFEDLSQSEIAERVGVSQMHVSRLLARSIGALRRLIDPEAMAGD